MDLLMPGALLKERYLIEKILHKGSHGGVYKAKDTRFPGRFWTVKEIILQPQDQEEQDAARKRFVPLVKRLSLFEHAALPKIVDYFSYSLRLYVITKYIDAQSLDDIFRKATIPFSEKQTILLGLQLVELLIYLYSKREDVRVSPDLKLTNLLVTARGEIKLVDLGLHGIVLEDNIVPAKVISMGYGAPELYEDKWTFNERSFIYSIGVVMHQMLTRRDPQDEPFIFPPVSELNPFVFPGTSLLVAKALAKSPSDRFESFEQFERELKERLQAVKTGRGLPPIVRRSKTKKFLFWPISVKKDIDFVNKNISNFGDGSDIPWGVKEQEMPWQQAVWWGILITVLSGLSFLAVYIWHLFSRR